MAKFMAVHPLPAPATVAELTPVAKLAKANSTLNAYWVGAWSQLNEEGKVVKILCQWNASNIEEVRKVVATLPCPTEGVYPIMMVDAEDFR